MAYATVDDVQARMSRTLTTDEREIVSKLLDDSAVIIDTFNANAPEENKTIVSCRMVIRALGSGDDIPIGATQGSKSGLGYSESWTISAGTVGELYLGKLEKTLLKSGNTIGSYSPTQALVPEVLQ